MITEKIKKIVADAAKQVGIEVPNVSLEHPDVLANGDYATNIALAAAKQVGKSPKAIAGDLKEMIVRNLPEEIERVDVAGAGFLNFYLSRKFFADSIKDISNNEDFGKGDELKGKIALFEYTDPNPFKAFHIGHLMANAVGESLSRLASFQNATVKRMCYGGDVGLHIAKAIWGMLQNKNAFPEDQDDLKDKIKFVADAYVAGNNAYEDDADAKSEIDEINKKVFEFQSGMPQDEDIEVVYKKGRKWSIDLFHQMYERLDSVFDYEVFESEVVEKGKEVVLENKNIFVESDGALVFKGEDHGLHTRVFITSKGLPTYETKEIGLFFHKFALENWDESIVITANEQKDYYKVVLCALNLLAPNTAKKTKHLTHGLLRFAEGKMSSRKGNIITAESFIDDVKDVAISKINKDGIGEDEKEKIAEAVSIAAIKYSILRQSPGKDIIFDREKALSFEGDSGPYLQYAYVRSFSLLEKAKSENVKAITKNAPEEIYEIEKILYRFPEITARAWNEKAPQLVVEYLTHLASSFNGFYASGMIVSKGADSPYKVAITKAFNTVMHNGLKLLAIPLLQKM